MPTRARSLILVAILVAWPVLAMAAATYRTVDRAPLAGGFLEIREDARITPALIDKMWQTAANPLFVLDEQDPAAKSFKAEPALPARLRQLDSAGRTVVDLVPDRLATLARLESQTLGPPTDPVYLITTDNSAGFGSYSGLLTVPYAVRAGRLKPIQAVGQGDQPKPVSLVATLKSGWKIIDAHPGHTVIQQLLCRPDFAHDKPGADAKFLLSYITYWSDGHGWRMAQHDEPGFWESDNDWPPPAKFPGPRAS